MNNKIKALLGLLAFAVLIVAAVFAYDRLQNEVESPDNLVLLGTEPDTDTEIQMELETEEDTPNPLQQAPDFTVFDMDGNEVSLSDLLGNPFVLNFWTTWCPSCVLESPYFEQLYLNMGNEVRILKVNLIDGQRETRQNVDDFITTHGYTFPVYFDTTGEASRAYSVRSIPNTFFINADGYIAARIMGIAREQTLQAGIDAILP